MEGVVNAELVADYENELRTSDCAVCGVPEVREKAVGRGLDTVIKCQACGFEYARREQ